ncbi:MAG: hydroxyethylthiazole kinase [Actinobacteria bacterium]|nr:hydroxyethylthiazole kinase [Actinomycetota bacterium]
MEHEHTAPDTGTSTVSPQACANALRSLRESGPLVQCLTNIVVANWTANVLLAVGAAPAMVDNPHEADGFARVSSAVLVNLGTPYDDTVAAMRAAVTGATAEGTPWVIDPVGAGGLPWRTEVARELLAAGSPSAIRGNASEIAGLMGGAGGRGVDSADDPEAAAQAAKLLALQHDCVVAVSGEVDLITDGRDTVRIANGHEWLTKVTGVGCSLGALMAAFSAVSEGCLVAATAATATLCVAAEDAAAVAGGPGSFAVALLDQLHVLSPERLAERVRLS